MNYKSVEADFSSLKKFHIANVNVDLSKFVKRFNIVAPVQEYLIHLNILKILNLNQKCI